MDVIEIFGHSKVETVRDHIRDRLGVNVRFVKADGGEVQGDVRFSEIRSKDPESTDLQVHGNMKVENVEAYFQNNYGVGVEVLTPAGAEADDEATISSIARQFDRSDEALPPLAAWINDRMQADGIDVDTLVERSGLALPTVRNLITGRTEYPQSKTIEEVEKALGAKVPAETTRSMTEDARVAGVGEMRSFDPHVKEDLPDEPGIYVFYDISERPVYVGKSESSIRNRVLSHQDRFYFKRPVVETAEYIAIEDAELMKKIETILIKFMKSNAVLNRRGVER